MAHSWPALQIIEATFIFCCVWSLGAVIAQEVGLPDRDRWGYLLAIQINATAMTASSVSMMMLQI